MGWGHQAGLDRRRESRARRGARRAQGGSRHDRTCHRRKSARRAGSAAGRRRGDERTPKRSRTHSRVASTARPGHGTARDRQRGYAGQAPARWVRFHGRPGSAKVGSSRLESIPAHAMQTVLRQSGLIADWWPCSSFVDVVARIRSARVCLLPELKAVCEAVDSDGRIRERAGAESGDAGPSTRRPERGLVSAGALVRRVVERARAQRRSSSVADPKVAQPDSGPLSVLLLVENASVPTDTRVWSECRSLREAGFDVVVISPKGASRDLEQFELRDGIAIHRFRMPYARGGPRSFVSEYSVAFWRISRIARQLARKRSFAVVHAANPPDFLLLAAWPLKRRGSRFIFDQHDLVPELYISRFGRTPRLLYWLTCALERLSFSLADVVVSPNNSYRNIALERGRKETDDVFVVRNAPDTSVFRPGKPDPELKHGKPHLLAYVGAMNA